MNEEENKEEAILEIELNGRCAFFGMRLVGVSWLNISIYY